MEDLLPSADGGPEALYARRVLVAEFERALGELPEEERRGVRRTRDRGTQLQADRRRDRREREHAAVAQALRGAPPARAAAARVRRIHDNAKDDRTWMSRTKCGRPSPGNESDGRQKDCDRHREASRSSWGSSSSSPSAASSCSCSGTGCCPRFRRARGYALAGARAAGAEPNPVRRIRTRRRFP